ncbi:unnamed protein product [Rhizophagus irregularis]|nr:unnamed protein product [Rhizophagus irregularis]CAB5360431.1 unnamed protein product [Rhizophagus irregularis]
MPKVVCLSLYDICSAFRLASTETNKWNIIRLPFLWENPFHGKTIPTQHYHSRLEGQPQWNLSHFMGKSISWEDNSYSTLSFPARRANAMESVSFSSDHTYECDLTSYE